ncbi:MAG: response regulator transcription factor [Fulvivirga sp.]
MSIRCCIVDDEPLARDGIAGYVEKLSYLKLVGSFSSALDLLQQLDELKPDLLFLDIEMPHLTGLEFVKSLSNPPKVIFTTAYDQYALAGFELDVLDYLMKPISFERFLKAVEKAKSQLQTPRESFFVKTDKSLKKVKFDEILYLESMQNYVILHLPDEKVITHNTLKALIEELPNHHFTQIHKQYVINNSHVSAIEGNQVVVGSGTLPISRTYREAALERLLKK